MEVQVLNSTDALAENEAQNGANAPVYPHSAPAQKPSRFYGGYLKNIRQLNSAAAGAIIFISGGMHIFWGIGPFPLAPLRSKYVQNCWFVAAILGAVFGAVLCNKLKERTFYMCAAVLVLLSGILIVCGKDNDALLSFIMAAKESIKLFSVLISAKDNGTLNCSITATKDSDAPFGSIKAAMDNFQYLIRMMAEKKDDELFRGTISAEDLIDCFGGIKAAKDAEEFLSDKMSAEDFDALLSSIMPLKDAVECSIGRMVAKRDDVMIAARYLNGFANGLVLVPTLVLVGEVGVKSQRGILASSIEALSFAIGIFLELIFGAMWKKDSNSLRYGMGGLSIIFGIISFLCAYFLTIESPVYLLRRDAVEKAIYVLRRVQHPFTMTSEINVQLEEHKRYIVHYMKMSIKESSIVGLPALVKISIYRGLVAISYCWLVNAAFLHGLSLNYLNNSGKCIIYGLMRVAGILIAAFMMDKIGRKKQALFSAIICAFLAIFVGCAYSGLELVLTNPAELKKMVILLYFFQLFAGLVIASSSVYLSEAFPLVIKPYYIAVAFIVEMLIHIIICCIEIENYDTSNWVKAFFFIVFVLMAAFSILGALYLPETKHTTLCEAEEKFREFRPVVAKRKFETIWARLCKCFE